MKQPWVGQHSAPRAHAAFLAELQQSLFSNDATPFIDLVGDVDLDRAHFGARPAKRGMKRKFTILLEVEARVENDTDRTGVGRAVAQAVRRGDKPGKCSCTPHSECI